MIQLSKTEEQLMEHIWKQGKVFMKDLIDRLDDPKPASTTVATLLKRMQEKRAIGYKMYGNSREYFPLVSKVDYFSKQVNSLVKDFFGDSALQFASFFTNNSNMTEAELQELKNIIDKQINKQK